MRDVRGAEITNLSLARIMDCGPRDILNTSIALYLRVSNKIDFWNF